MTQLDLIPRPPIYRHQEPRPEPVWTLRDRKTGRYVDAHHDGRGIDDRAARSHRVYERTMRIDANVRALFMPLDAARRAG